MASMSEDAGTKIANAFVNLIEPRCVPNFRPLTFETPSEGRRIIWRRANEGCDMEH